MNGAKTQWSRQEVARRILDGETLVVYDNFLLRIPQTWLRAHPGGSLAILHFVGRDATDEIDAYHSSDTIHKIKLFIIGTVETSPAGWLPFLPPIMTGWVRVPASDGSIMWHREASVVPSRSSSEVLLMANHHLTGPQSPNICAPSLSDLTPSPSTLSFDIQAQHSAAYKQLHKTIIDAGLYNTRYIMGYGPELARYLILGGACIYTYSNNWLITSAVCLGLLWHQLVFTVHDLGHMGVTHNWTVDRLIGIFLGDFIGGLSVGWWVDVSASAFFWQLELSPSSPRITMCTIVCTAYSLLIHS